MMMFNGDGGKYLCFFLVSLQHSSLFAPVRSDPAGAALAFRFPAAVAFNAAGQQCQRTYFSANLVEIEEGNPVEQSSYSSSSAPSHPFSPPPRFYQGEVLVGSKVSDQQAVQRK